EVQGHDVALSGRPIKTIALVGRTENKQLSVTFTTDLFGQSVVTTALVNLATEQLPATIDATLNDADLTNLLAIALPNTGVKLTGRATATIKASGNLVDEDGYFSLDGLRGTAEFKNLSFQVAEIPIAATEPFTVHLTTNEVGFDRTRFPG